MRLLATVFTTAVLVGVAGGAIADEAADREAINALMWQYARALDTTDAEAYVAAFTPDGEFKSGATSAKGTAALQAMVVDVKEGRDKRAAAGEAVAPMYHMTTDSWIEFIDDTHARHHSYWLTVFGASGTGTTPNVAAAGYGIDELVKVEGKWFIKLRDVAP